MEHWSDNLPCIYFAVSGNDRITAANNVLCRYLGYLPQELVDKKVEVIFTLATRIFQQTHFFPLLRMQGHAEEIYITLQAKNGDHLPVLINAERLEADGEATIRFAGIAVNKRKKFEEEIIAAKKLAEAALNENTALLQAKESLQKQAEQLDRQMQQTSNQNVELRQFSRVVTHDLQEPLRKLSYYASVMLDAEDLQNRKEAVQKIKTSSEQMRSIVSGLQQYIWLTEGRVETSTVSLDAVLKTATNQVEAENLGVSFSLQAGPLPVIEANEDQVRFLLHQLLSNAVRFRRPDLSLNVQVEASTLLLNKFQQLGDKYKYIEFVKLQIQDNGSGFDNAYKDQAFELFRRLHSTSGRGIGLSLCRKIVENHNGTLTLETSSGTGTTVTVLLPVNQEAWADEDTKETVL